MLLWLFSLVLVANSAFLTTLAPSGIKACDGGESIKLTPSGYYLPLTTYPDSALCSYNFAVPQGYFAYVELNAIQLQQYERVEIRDIKGTGAISDFDETSFTSSQAWPLDFHVDVQTLYGSFARLSLNVTLFPATPYANIVKSYVTFPGSNSVFLFSSQWNEGESYRITSKTGKLYVLVASQLNDTVYDDNSWNNVFVYDRGVLQGTLARAAQSTLKQVPYESTSNDVILYCAKKVNVVGAAMITDLSNVQGVTHTMEYVPDVPGPFPYQLSGIDSESAITLVSSKQNPQKVTIEMVYNLNGGDGIFSYIGGGPIQNHSNAVKLTDAKLPKNIKGYANTYYLSKGDGMIGFDIKP